MSSICKSFSVDHVLYTIHVSYHISYTMDEMVPGNFSYSLSGLLVEMAEPIADKKYFHIESTLRSVYDQVLSSRFDQYATLVYRNDTLYFKTTSKFKDVLNDVMNFNLGRILYEFARIFPMNVNNIDIDDVELNPVKYLSIEPETNVYISLIEYYANTLVK